MRVCPGCGELSRPSVRCGHCGAVLRGRALPARLALVGLTVLTGVSCVESHYGIANVAFCDYEDRDRDGAGAECYGDCDDSDPQVHPQAEETAGDGIDSNCDGEDDPVDPGDTGE